MDDSPSISLISSSSLTLTQQGPSASRLAIPNVEKTWSSEMALAGRHITMEQFVEEIDEQQLDPDPSVETEDEEEEEEAEETDEERRKPEAEKSCRSRKRWNEKEIGIWSRIRMATGRQVPRKRRFVTISRLILYALWWQRFGPLAMEERRREAEGASSEELQGLIDAEEEEEGEGEEGGGQLFFDPTLFQTKWAANKDLLRGLLDRRIVDALRRQQWQRTTEEIDDIEKFVVSRLRFFSTYPERVRVEVGRVMSLEVVTRGRVIVRQGDPASGYYFLVRGAAIVLLTVPDDEGRSKRRLIGTLEAGSCFGATALLNNIRRGTTIVSKGTSELLRVDKDDFRSILDWTYEDELQTRLDFMSRLPQFVGVEPETLRICSKHSVLYAYEMDKVVSPPPNKTNDQLIRFIVTGSCNVIRRNLCRPESSLGQSEGTRTIPTTCPDPWELGGRRKRKSFTFTSDPRAKVKPPSEVSGLAPSGGRARYLHVGILDTGAYFGLGEDLSNYIIVSKTRLQLLLLPRSIFLHHFGALRLRTLRQELEQAIPSEPEVCRLYTEDIRWTRYKQEVVEENLEHVIRVRNSRLLRALKEGARARSKVEENPRLVIG